MNMRMNNVIIRTNKKSNQLNKIKEIVFPSEMQLFEKQEFIKNNSYILKIQNILENI